MDAATDVFLKIIVILVGILFYLAIGSWLTEVLYDREDKWKQSKEDFSANLLLTLGWPIILVLNILKFLLYTGPVRLFRWWQSLPDQNPNK